MSVFKELKKYRDINYQECDVLEIKPDIPFKICVKDRGEMVRIAFYFTFTKESDAQSWVSDWIDRELKAYKLIDTFSIELGGKDNVISTIVYLENL